MNPQPHRWDAELAGLVDDDRAARGLPPLGDIPIVDRRQSPDDGRVDRVGPAPTTIGTTEQERLQAAAQIRSSHVPAAPVRQPSVPPPAPPPGTGTASTISSGRLVALWALVAVGMLNVAGWLAPLWVPAVLHVAIGPVRQLLAAVWLGVAATAAVVGLAARRRR